MLSFVREHARSRGEAPYLTAVSRSGEVEQLTYAALDVLNAKVAGWAERELGSVRTVAFLPANDIPSVLAILGLMRSRRPVLLVNPADPPGRVREQAATLDATLLRAATIDPALHPDAVGIPDPRILPDDDAPFAEPEIEASEDALFFGTSGSTASSKLVAQTHANTVANALGVGRHHRLRPGERILGCLPIHHVNGLHFTILATLVAGAHAVLAPGFEAITYPDLVRRFRPRVASVVPTILEVLVGTWRGEPPPRELEYFLSAAAPLTARTARAVVDGLGVRVVQGYGLTETTNLSTTLPIDLPDAAYRRLMLDAAIPSVGVALPGNEVAVLDAGGEAVPPGERGEICMRGHNVMARYASNEGATEEAFAGGWFHSGDIGFSIEDAGGTVFMLTGRRKNIAKVRGESVSLDEMDRVLRAVPEVRDAACVAIPHRLLGEEIVAVVVVADGTRGTDLRARLGATFAQTVLPRRIVEVASLPRTPTGKVRRGELAASIASKLAHGEL